jgi:hypothetical protein
LKISFIDLIRSAFSKKDEKFRHKLYIFLVCLIISMIIWFTIKLSDEYDTVIQVPVTFTHIPKNKVLTFVSDSVLQVEVQDKGSNLFRMIYVEDVRPYSLSLRFLPIYPKGYEFYGMISTAVLINELEREEGLLGKIISVSPDTIYLKFQSEKSRKVPVKARLDVSFEKQFMKYGNVEYSPDSVVVIGPEETIEKLDSASLGDIHAEQLNQNFSGEKNFPADTLNMHLSFSPEKITYTIPVEKYTEVETEVPVKIINAADNRVKIFPDKVKIYYNVALKDYPKIEPGMISLVADFSTVDLSMENKVKVSLESYPEYIRINKLAPEKVEFIIIK